MNDTETTELRLYCIMRSDLNAPVGKLMAQAGHAFVGCVVNCPQKILIDYINDGSQPKIVLKAKNERVLHRATNECKELGIPCYLVTDAGRTVFTEPTVTCLGIGPVAKQDLPKFITKLQLLEHMNVDNS